jgi:hypothetical protein
MGYSSACLLLLATTASVLPGEKNHSCFVSGEVKKDSELIDLSVQPIARTTMHDPFHAIDDDETTVMSMTHMQNCRPGTCGMQIHTRSAVKITRIVLLEDPKQYLHSGRIVAVKGSRTQVVAQFVGNDSGRNEIQLWPPLKISHAPFYFMLEVDRQPTVWNLFEMRIYSSTPVPPKPPPPPAPSPKSNSMPSPPPRVRMSDVHSFGKDFQGPGGDKIPRGQPPIPPPHREQAPPVRKQAVACVPACVHGQCSVQSDRGVCVCDEGYRGDHCSVVRCGECQNGECLQPDDCSCKRGWSGASCDVPGTVQYGSSWIKLGSGNRKGELLFSTAELRSAVSTAQAVINYRHPSADSDGNWWQVLGPLGTSDAFLNNHDVPSGATIRLRHVSSGALLQGDATQAALARADLREVSCLRNDSASTGDEEWVLLVNGSSVGPLVWGIGSAVTVTHVGSQTVLTCAGQTYQAKNQDAILGKRHAAVYEAQLQAAIPDALTQRWSVAEHTTAHSAPAFVGVHTIIRLTSLNSACYLVERSDVSQGVDGVGALKCELDDRIASLWVVVPLAADGDGDADAAKSFEEQLEAATAKALAEHAKGAEVELKVLKLWKLMARVVLGGEFICAAPCIVT